MAATENKEKLYKSLEKWMGRLDMLVSNLLEHKKLYYQIFLTDRSGHKLFGKKYINNRVIDLKGLPADFKDSPLFKDTLKLGKEEVFTGNIFFLEDAKNRSVIELGIPVIINEKLLGGLFLTLFSEGFINDLKSRENGKGTYHLVTGEGKVLYGNSNTNKKGKKIEKTLSLNAKENIQLIIGHTWEDVT